MSEHHDLTTSTINKHAVIVLILALIVSHCFVICVVHQWNRDLILLDFQYVQCVELNQFDWINTRILRIDISLFAVTPGHLLYDCTYMEELKIGNFLTRVEDPSQLLDSKEIDFYCFLEWFNYLQLCFKHQCYTRHTFCELRMILERFLGFYSENSNSVTFWTIWTKKIVLRKTSR